MTVQNDFFFQLNDLATQHLSFRRMFGSRSPKCWSLILVTSAFFLWMPFRTYLVISCDILWYLVWIWLDSNWSFFLLFCKHSSTTQHSLRRVVPQILLTIENPAPKYPVTAEARNGADTFFWHRFGTGEIMKSGGKTSPVLFFKYPLVI